MELGIRPKLGGQRQTGADEKSPQHCLDSSRAGSGVKVRPRTNLPKKFDPISARVATAAPVAAAGRPGRNYTPFSTGYSWSSGPVDRPGLEDIESCVAGNVLDCPQKHAVRQISREALREEATAGQKRGKRKIGKKDRRKHNAQSKAAVKNKDVAPKGGKSEDLPHATEVR